MKLSGLLAVISFALAMFFAGVMVGKARYKTDEIVPHLWGTKCNMVQGEIHCVTATEKIWNERN